MKTGSIWQDFLRAVFWLLFLTTCASIALIARHWADQHPLKEAFPRELPFAEVFPALENDPLQDRLFIDGRWVYPAYRIEVTDEAVEGQKELLGFAIHLELQGLMRRLELLLAVTPEGGIEQAVFLKDGDVSASSGLPAREEAFLKALVSGEDLNTARPVMASNRAVLAGLRETIAYYERNRDALLLYALPPEPVTLALPEAEKTFLDKAFELFQDPEHESS